MTFDLSNDFHRKSFLAKAENLLDKCACVELTEKTGKTGNQNRYVHLIIGVLAMETGNTLEYAKREYFKKIANHDLFVKEVDDRFAGHIEVLRSITDLTKEEMSIAIDRFKRWAAGEGIYLPSPDDASLLATIEMEMGRMRKYL